VSEIKPALKAEEWATAERTPRSVGINFARVMALANHDMPDDDPRKITRADVELLEWVAEQMRKAPIGVPDGDYKVDRLADRLAALLPPDSA
jgi:hypothetical protein